MTAFIPEEQTLLTVVQETELGKPAPSAACLAGAWPRLAVSTFPMNTSCTSAGSTLALLRALWMATEPSLVAGSDDSDPSSAPMGVRATPTTQTSRGFRPWSPGSRASALDDAMIDRRGGKRRRLAAAGELRNREADAEPKATEGAQWVCAATSLSPFGKF
jgi:hypothetical protein